MPQLLTSGNRPPLGPEGPILTSFNAYPDWVPFEVPEHLKPRERNMTTERVLGRIAEVLAVEPPEPIDPDPMLN